MSANDTYEPENGMAVDNDYASRTGQSEVPVVKDDSNIEDPIDPEKADSDETLEQDDKEAIDKSNIIGDRTRYATKPGGTYREPGDTEGIPDAQ